MKLLITFLLSTHLAFGCLVTGRTLNGPQGVRGSYVFAVDVTEGSGGSFIAGRSVSNTFGYYRFEIPCGRDYELIAWDKRFTYDAYKVSGLPSSVVLNFYAQ